MDETISKWILEFLLRQPIPERLINGLLESLPSLGDDNWLKKILLLRKIEFEIANSEISEKLLDLFEFIEELDHQEGRECPDSMKSAYCAVAVDCMVRFLDDRHENNVNNGDYFEAVKRVWRNRARKIKSLASEESRQKMEEIEVALWDSETCAKLLGLNTRVLALRLVRVYVEEEWRAMGPSFLELVASKAGNELEELRRGGDYGETQKGQTHVKRKHIKMKRKCGDGAKISHLDKKAEVITGKTVKAPAPEVDKVPIAIESSPMETEQQTSKKVDLPNAQTAQTDVITGETDKTRAPEVDKVPAEIESNPKKQKTSKKVDLPSAQTLRDVVDNIYTETLLENQPAPKMDASSEVDRVQEALKSCSMELHAAVRETNASPRASIGEIQKDQAQYCPNYITVRGKLGNGDKIIIVDEEDDVLVQETVKIPPTEVDRVPDSVESSPKDALRSSSMELRTSGLDALQTAQGLQKNVSRSDLLLLLSLRDMEFEEADATSGTVAEHADKTNMETDVRDPLQTTVTSGSIDNRSNEQLGTYTDSNKRKIAADDDEEHADETNIESDVRDPLQTTGTLGSTDNRSNEHLGTFTDSSKEKISGKRQNPTQDPEGSGAQHEQPPEATVERGDSTDKLPQSPTSSPSPSKRPHLPSPKVNKPASPLKKYDSNNVVRRRRATTWWVPEEENALREGVAKLGKGRWKEILVAYWDIFEKRNRTDVDLKDKWRTLTKKR